MSRILVSAGCSFAFGANLQDKEQRYSRTLATHYGMELIDVALPGVSNQHIVSAACYGIQQALKRESPKTNDKKVAAQKIFESNKDKGNGEIASEACSVLEDHGTEAGRVVDDLGNYLGKALGK